MMTESNERGAGTAGAFWLAFFIPIVGLVLGLIHAFDPDPLKKAEAGWNFGGAVAGFILGSVLLTVAWPMLALGSLGGSDYDQGVAAYGAGHMIEAESDFRAAVKSDPGLAIAWVNCAAAQLKQGNNVGAADSARRAVALVDSGRVGGVPSGETTQSVSGLAHGNLAVALSGLLRFAEAATEARKALELYADSPVAPNWRLIAKLDSGGALASTP